MQISLRLLVLALLLHGCSKEASGEVFRSFQLGDAELELRATSGWAFGSHTVHFYEVRPGFRRHLGSTELANDGASLSDGNATLSALERGCWELVLSGAEDEGQTWLVERARPGLLIQQR
jgi:hypothetical protein